MDCDQHTRDIEQLTTNCDLHIMECDQHIVDCNQHTIDCDQHCGPDDQHTMNYRGVYAPPPFHDTFLVVAKAGWTHAAVQGSLYLWGSTLVLLSQLIAFIRYIMNHNSGS